MREGLFTVAADGSAHLLGARCGRCGEHHFPATGSCPHCSAEDVTEVALSDAGTLWAWTAVTAPPPGYRGAVPFGFGVIELPEGMRVITRITEADPSRLRLGQAMTLEIVPLHEGDDGRPVVTYAFGPTAGSTAGGGAGGTRRTGPPGNPAEGGDGAPPGAAKPPAEQA